MHGIMEKKMETAIMGYIGIIGYMCFVFLVVKPSKILFLI